MKKRDLIWVVLLISALLAFLFILGREKPYLYQGKHPWQWSAQLQHVDTQKREEANAAFRAMGSNAVPPLITCLENKQPMMHKVRFWLGERIPGRLGKAMTTGLTPDFTPDTRAVAAHGLAFMGTNAVAATPALLRALRDSDRQVTWNSASALGAIGAPAVPGLMKLLNDRNPNVRHAAAYALGIVGEPALPAAPALLQGACDTNLTPIIRESYVDSLGRIGHPSGPFLISAVQTNHGEPRRVAMKALSVSNSRRRATFPVLLEAMRDADPASRANAIEALSKFGLYETNTIAACTAALSDTNANVRAAAAKALGATYFQRGSNAIPILAELQTSDPDESVRTAAGEAIKKLQPNSGQTP